MSYILSFFQNLFGSLPRLIACLLGVLWAYIEPTLHYEAICVFAVLLDCLTAYRLNRRIKQRFPHAKTDGKLKSARMSKMISDLVMVWLCILLAMKVDDNLLYHFGGLHLAQYVAAIFVLCTVVSILENESSCNGSTWARVVQKFVTSKVSRHLDLSEEEMRELLGKDVARMQEESTNEKP